MRNCGKIFALALAAVAALSCTVKENAGGDPATENTVLNESACIPGALTIEVSEDIAPLLEAGEEGLTRSESVNAELQQLGVVSISRVFPDAGEYEARSREMGLHRFYKVRFGRELPLTRASAGLESLEWVEKAEPVHRIRRRAIFNDPLLSRQWHYINNSTSGADINVQQVWSNYTVGSSKVIVAVVDEAVCYTHPDLEDNMWSDAQGHHGYNFWDDNWDLNWLHEDDLGHGTHVAGTVAAVNNNSVGVCGVAGGDAAKGIAGVRIMSCQIFGDYDEDEEYSGDEDDDEAANAIKWGADHGAVISQNSWGYYADTNNDGRISSSELNSYRQMSIPSAIKAAIDYFIRYAGCDAQGNQKADSPMKGGLVFFAAGNENINYDPICAYTPVIAVGAFRENGNKASYSNYGSWVDIAAPGGEGTSSANSIWSTLPTQYASSGYAGVEWAGTSMACPHASGVAALLVSYFGKSGFTADKCKSYIMGGLGSTIGGSSPVGKKLDALAAFQYALAQGETPGGEGGEGGGGGTDDPDPDDPDPDDPDPQNEAPSIVLGASSLNLKTYETTTVSVSGGDPNPGDVLTYSCTPGSAALTFNSSTRLATIDASKAAPGKYTAVFKVTDKGGLSAQASLEYTIQASVAPTVNLDATTLVLKARGTASVKMSASDPDEGDVLTLSCTPGSNALSFDPASGVATLNAGRASAGKYTAVFKATDRRGLSAEASLSYTILPNHPPVPVAEKKELLIANPGQVAVIVLGELFSDSDEDILSYSTDISGDAVSITVLPEGKMQVVGVKEGYATLLISARDPAGASANMLYEIVVRTSETLNDVQVYPVLVQKGFYVRTGANVSGTVEVSVHNGNGSRVMQISAQGSVFDPVYVNIENLPPSVYSVVVKCNGQSWKEQIVKF